MSDMEGMTMKSVAIIGGGLVGSLEACFMARRNYKVDVYEMRPDIRSTEIVRGRSVNIALSVRGMEALKKVGLEEEIIKHGIPMYARLIHDLNGKKRPIHYGKKDQFIMSVNRCVINELLLTAAEKIPSVSLHFEHKALECTFDTGTVVFRKPDGSTVTVTADVIVGCDGAFSAVRQQMMKHSLLDYEQIFIPHGYMELHMPATEAGQFAMEINYLHIWARNEYMMIALPNQDKSFTVTLFMPFDIFKTLTTEEAVLKFFRSNFADSIPLLDEKRFVETVTKGKVAPMITVKYSQYHIKDKAVIMGDAAHAMVPFYGQGVNCGFEDCIVLDDILKKHDGDFGAALNEFTAYRSIDAKAICDLSFYNYKEMRQSVNSRIFLLRKKADTFLFWLCPSAWIPLYTMVSFSRIRYHECFKNKAWQDKMISRTVYLSVPFLVLTGYCLYRHVATTDVPMQDKVLSLVERLERLWQSWM